ncbi:hypothetical protein SOVF_047450 [Spinacia oleracea]|nr:hypothetical protein SOVF_047450 [Spinacia oleracea]
MGFPLDRVRYLDRTGASQSQSTSFSFGPGFVNNEQIGSNKTPYTPTYGGSSERFMSLSAMNDYSNKSHEELRYEDYQLGIKGTSSETEYSEPVQAPLPSSLFSSSPFSNIENKRDHSKQQQASFPSTVFSALPSQSGLLSAFPGFPIPGSPPTAAYAPPFGKSTSTPQHASQIGTPSSSAQPVFGGFRGCNCKCNCNQRAFPQINSTAPSTNVFANAGYPYPVYSFPAFVTIRPDAAAAQHFGNFGLTFGESTTPSFPASAMLPFGTPALGASITPAFGASTMSAFPASTMLAFGASTTPAFGVSTTATFGATTTPAFGASTTPFGASIRPAFGASTTPFGLSTAPAFGVSTAPSFPASTTPAFGSSTTPAFGASTTPVSGFAPSVFPPSTSAFGAPTLPTFGASTLPASEF